MAERSDVYARILLRVEPQELCEQCHSVVLSDAKLTHEQFAQLHSALHRLQEVSAATRRLLREQHHDQLNGSNAQLIELFALRDRLTAALDTLMKSPHSISVSEVQKDATSVNDNKASRSVAATMVEEAYMIEQFAAQQKLASPVHDTPAKLAPAVKVALQIKQEYPTLASTNKALAGKRELDWTSHYPTASREWKTEVTIDLSDESDDVNPAEPLTFVKAKSDPQSASCLTDAQLLWRSGTSAQSHQLPFFIRKLRNYLFARAHLSPTEVQETAEAIEIAAFIGMNPEAVRPNEPALADLLIAIEHLQAFAGESIPLQVSKNINRFIAYLLATTTVADVALGDPYIVQHGDDTVIRVNV